MPPTPVYVWPQSLLAGIYADLHKGTEPNNGPNTVHMIGEPPSREVQACIYMDLETDLVPSGRITLSARGGKSQALVEAERSAVLGVLQQVRSQHLIFLVDYNYMYVIRKRPLFDAMKTALFSLRSSWLEMEILMKDISSGITDLYNSLSTWLGEPSLETEFDHIVAVAAFEASMRLQGTEVHRDIVHIALLSDMIMLRDVEPNGQGVVEATTPMPVDVDWERSLYLLRSIYKEAIKKLRGTVTPTKYVVMPDGRFKAHIDVTSEPYMFWGPAVATKKAARASLYYLVIKHVNVTMGHDVIDLHYPIRHYMDLFIQRFDIKMSGIWRLAYRYKSLTDSTVSTFHDSLGELNSIVPLGVDVQPVFQHINSFSAFIRGKKDIINIIWQRVGDTMVDRATVESKFPTHN